MAKNLFYPPDTRDYRYLAQRERSDAALSVRVHTHLPLQIHNPAEVIRLRGAISRITVRLKSAEKTTRANGCHRTPARDAAQLNRSLPQPSLPAPFWAYRCSSMHRHKQGDLTRMSTLALTPA